MESILTICIPTYNRANALDKVLQYLSDYYNRGLVFDVLISDNASTDNTFGIVSKWKESMPSISYHRQPKNMGSDYNFMTCFSLFKTEFCWLLGDTRYVEYKELDFLLSELSDKNQRYDGYIINCRKDLELPTKVYTEINALVSEQGWHMTNNASCIITKKSFKYGRYHRYLNTWFIHEGGFIEYLCTLDEFKVKYFSKNNISVKGFSKLDNFDKKNTSWMPNVLDIFGRCWYMFVMSLPNQIRIDVKEKVCKDHDRFTHIISPKFYISYIASGNKYFISEFRKYNKYLNFVTDYSLWIYKLIIFCSPLIQQIYRIWLYLKAKKKY
jgi:glycosyltransferase involved in cell wall biosynthesis